MATMHVLKGKRILYKECKVLKSILSQSIGLMFSRQKENFCLIFDFARPINVSMHMFFVFYPIDVIFLCEGRIVEWIKDFRPFQTYKSEEKADMMLEVPKGSIRQHRLKQGDRLRIEKSI